MKLVVDKLYNDEEFKISKGTLITDSDIRHPIIDKDTDVYWRDGDNEILLCKFRKNVIDNDLINLAWDSYKDLANEVMSPSDKEVNQAKRILEAMEVAKKEGKGAVSLDGRLIDIASIRQAEVLVQKAKLIEGR